jgi:branched-chain amino acid transport system permease protein
MARRSWQALPLVGLLAAGVLYPRLLPGDYFLHLGIVVSLYIILTSSLNLIMGITGQFAVAHAAFYGVGAYGSILLVTRLGVPYWWAWIAGILLAGIAALIIGASTLHLKGAYLAICTFAFSELFRLLLDNWVSLTNGANGIIIRFVPPPVGIPGLFRFELGTRRSYFQLMFGFAVFTVWFVRRLARSDLGRVLGAIRQDETLALTAGFDTMRYKLLAFTVGSMFAGLAGATYAPYLSYIAPDLFDVNETIYIMMIMMIGGIRSIWGPVWGSILLVSLPQALDITPLLRMIAYGLVLILVMIRMPDGLAGFLDRLVSRLRPGGTWFGQKA